MNKSHFVKYIGQILNIDADNELVMADILEDLSQIEDLATFRLFIKERFNYERFKYLTGLQKFIALKNEFIKENKPKLDANQDFKVRNYSDNLFSRVTTVFDEVDFLTQAGTDIQDKKINNILYKEFGEDKKALKVLEKIGKRQDILNLLRRDRQGLHDKIKDIVFNLTLISEYPQLVNKNKDKQVLQMLINKKGK